MKKIVIVFLLFIIAAVSDAVMDTSQHHKGGALCRLTENSSVQQWCNCSGDSWLNKYQDRQPDKGTRSFIFLGFSLPYPVQLTDSFHFAKMIMIFALCAIVAFAVMPAKKLTPFPATDFFLYWTIAGLLWGAGFNLFYSYLLK